MREYEKPVLEIIEFQVAENIMDFISGEGNQNTDVGFESISEQSL